MNDLLTLTAEVLEKAAAYIEAVETEKSSVEKNAKIKLATEIQTSLSALAGEEVSAEMAEKLAESKDVLALLTKIAGANAPADKLGDAGDRQDGSTLTPRSVKEASAAADKNFENWLIS
jgi:hypothetical protein